MSRAIDEEDRIVLEAAIQRGWIHESEARRVQRALEGGGESRFATQILGQDFGVSAADLAELFTPGNSTVDPLFPSSDVFCRADSWPGVRLGDFDVLELIGQGGMGVVVRARHRVKKKLVAIKLLIAGPQASEHQVRRFRREARLSERLVHPDMVRVHEVGSTHACLYLVMDLVEGAVDLDRWVRQQGLASKEILQLLMRVSAAAGYAHQRYVIHRDLKPANILVDQDGQPRILDFGLAKSLRGWGSSRIPMTRSGMRVGTPRYMAPEQARGEIGNLDPRTDVYALGLIIQECVTGQHPLSGEQIRRLYRTGRSQVPTPISGQIEAQLPGLGRVLSKALADKQSSRQANGVELARDLGRVLRGERIDWIPESEDQMARSLFRWIGRRR